MELETQLAYSLHYNCWYKNAIEGKFGLETDGADHGRFRKSKNAELDADFVDNLQFDQNGNSLLTTPQGFPYYKMENGQFMVDSALKGFDHLPPSWQQENIMAAQVLLKLLKYCIINNKSITRYITTLSEEIHNQWVARQVSNELGIPVEKAYFLGTLSYAESKELPDNTNSDLYNAFGEEKLKNVWGWQNFADFDCLPFDEQIKDTMQLQYLLEVVLSSDNELTQLAQQYNYPLEQEKQKVENIIKQLQVQKDYSQLKEANKI